MAMAMAMAMRRAGDDEGGHLKWRIERLNV